MIISEKQLQMLLQVLADSLCIVNTFSFSQDSRIALYEQIMKQQSEELNMISDESNIIRIKETSKEFRKGFISATKCIYDMRHSHDYESLLRVVGSIITLHDSGNFFKFSEELKEME